MARPTIRTPEIEDAILNRISDGESLVSICKSEDMPSPATVYRWLQADTGFCDRYARAREDQADTLADEIIYIADNPVLGVKTKTLEDGGVETTEGDMIEHRRLQVEARKWIAAKLKPKKYGERLDHNVSVNPIAVNISLDSD